ncbi:MAG: transposase family protein [Trichodesmium sp. MAG_R01]|nr:transposase family protein [Trichodesmium sp. MAG_R01]
MYSYNNQKNLIKNKNFREIKEIKEPRELRYRKKSRQELPPEIKEENQQKSQKRIFVEHVIRLIKIFGVARERFRLKDSNYQKVILTICGLVRLRIGVLILL